MREIKVQYLENVVDLDNLRAGMGVRVRFTDGEEEAVVCRINRNFISVSLVDQNSARHYYCGRDEELSVSQGSIVMPFSKEDKCMIRYGNDTSTYLQLQLIAKNTGVFQFGGSN